MKTSSGPAVALVAAVGILALLGRPDPANAQITDDVVRIGVLTDMSGPYSDPTGAGSVEAARIAVEDFGGSVLGKRVEVVFADHQNKPDVGSTIARQWFDRDGVDLIVDVPHSSVALAVQQVARERNKVVVFSGAATGDLTGKACSPNGVHWTYDTYSQAQGTGSAIVKSGGDTWFLLALDNAFGQSMQRDLGATVAAGGGKVLGSVRHPLNASDFSSFLLQAQSSGAKVIGLLNAGADTVNAVKEAANFGLTQGGRQKLAALIVLITEVHGLGLQATQGLQFTEAFYWDQSDATRAFAKRFEARMKRMPTMVQAGVYGAVLHYLKGVRAAGSDADGKHVVARMKALSIEDFMTQSGARIREDGRVMRDFYLFEVKRPDEVKYPWDYYKLVRTIPAEDATRPLAQSECPLLAKN